MKGSGLGNALDSRPQAVFQYGLEMKDDEMRGALKPATTLATAACFAVCIPYRVQTAAHAAQHTDKEKA